MSPSSPLRVLRSISPSRNRAQASPQTSPKQPLGERGASARNVQPPRSAGSLYGKTPFPKLASQVLAPQGARPSQEILEDAENVPPQDAGSPLLLPKLLALHPHPTDSAFASPETVMSSPETVIASPTTAELEGSGPAPNIRQSIDLVMPAHVSQDTFSTADSLTPEEEESIVETAREIRIENKRASSARLSDYSIFPSERHSQPPRISLALTNPHIRSTSTASSNNWQAFPGASPDSARSPELSGHRRASSSPTSSNFSAIAAADGLGIQGIDYSNTTRTSTASAESTPRKSSGPIRRLQRKRAVSNLGRSAGGFSQNAHSRTSSVDTGLQPTENWAPISTLDVINDLRPSVSPVPEEQSSSPSASSDNISQHWGRSHHSEHRDELPQPRPPMPALTSKPSFRAFDSRPSSSADPKSAVGSFYNFLNDSYTAWTRYYYGAESTITFNHSSQPSLSARSASQSRDRSRSRSRNRNASSGRGRFSQFSRFSRSSRGTTTTTTTTSHEHDVPAVPRIPSQMMRSTNNNHKHSVHKSKNSALTQFTNFTHSTRPAYHSGMPDPQEYPLHFHSTNPSMNSRYTAELDLPHDGSGRHDSPLHIVNVSRPPTSSSYSSWAPTNPSRIDSRIESPMSAGFPDMVYVPRIRPRIHEPESIGSGDSVILVDDDNATPSSEEAASTRVADAGAAHQSAVPVPTIEVIGTPRLPRDRRSQGMIVSEGWRAPEFEEKKGVGDRVNRQILLFVVGFVFPIAWILAAILPIPKRPEMRMLGTTDDYVNAHDAAVSSFDLFNEVEVVRWQKARRWRLTNRIMSGVGLVIVGVIGACAGVAAK